MAPEWKSRFARINCFVKIDLERLWSRRLRAEKSTQNFRIKIFKLSHQSPKVSNREILDFWSETKVEIDCRNSGSLRSLALNFQIPQRRVEKAPSSREMKSWSEKVQGRTRFEQTTFKRDWEIKKRSSLEAWVLFLLDQVKEIPRGFSLR